MRNSKLRVAVMAFVAGAAIAGGLAWARPAFAFRFCCTPQQSASCAAQGGTASCRTGVCQCLR